MANAFQLLRVENNDDGSIDMTFRWDGNGGEQEFMYHFLNKDNLFDIVNNWPSTPDQAAVIVARNWLGLNPGADDITLAKSTISPPVKLAPAAPIGPVIG